VGLWVVSGEWVYRGCKGARPRLRGEREKFGGDVRW
jgi:hypothetical protein